MTSCGFTTWQVLAETCTNPFGLVQGVSKTKLLLGCSGGSVTQLLEAACVPWLVTFSFPYGSSLSVKCLPHQLFCCLFPVKKFFEDGAYSDNPASHFKFIWLVTLIPFYKEYPQRLDCLLAITCVVLIACRTECTPPWGDNCVLDRLVRLWKSGLRAGPSWFKWRQCRNQFKNEVVRIMRPGWLTVGGRL